ncbi:MAG: glycosyltransferase family 39 protein [Vicinamibacterales bacterium]|nr:glycosyltransferase family 39 protein [Vicinamibacterales bacterium]
MPASTPTRRVIYLIACLAPVWAVIAFVTDGFSFRIGPLNVKATEPIRPLVIGAAATVFYAWRYSGHDIDAFWRRIFTFITRAAVVATPAVVCLGAFIGIYYGSFTAGGSDSYGYVSQAQLWLKGSLRIEQPWVQEFSWPYREWTFAPLGYRPLSADGTIVPTYASGLPMLMAVFQGLFGTNGPFLVVPVLGSLALWVTYQLGSRTTGSKPTGVLASLLLIASPVFLSHLMQPMTDVPVAAGWGLVAMLALREPEPRALAAGLAAGAALLVRPNLALLTLVPVITWYGRPRHVARFAAGLVPGVTVVALLNTYLYGSPLQSGYGGLSDIYDWRSALPNLKHYALWFAETQTPLVALALLPIVTPGAFRSDVHARTRLCLGSLVALTVVSYVFYRPFDQWTYLRFLLPAYPAILVLMAAAIRFTCHKLPAPIRAPVAMAVCAFCLASSYLFARDQFVFTSREFEQRYIRAAEYVAQVTPENAVIVCAQHSGSLRYYAHRITLRYDSVYEHRLDTTLNELRAKGRRPYIVVDDWEEAEFRRRFAAQSRAGRLDWKPLVTVRTNPEVRIYDPEGRSE